MYDAWPLSTETRTRSMKRPVMVWSETLPDRTRMILNDAFSENPCESQYDRRIALTYLLKSMLRDLITVKYCSRYDHMCNSLELYTANHFYVISFASVLSRSHVWFWCRLFPTGITHSESAAWSLYYVKKLLVSTMIYVFLYAKYDDNAMTC